MFEGKASGVNQKLGTTLDILFLLAHLVSRLDGPLQNLEGAPPLPGHSMWARAALVQHAAGTTIC